MRVCPEEATLVLVIIRLGTVIVNRRGRRERERESRLKEKEIIYTSDG